MTIPITAADVDRLTFDVEGSMIGMALGYLPEVYSTI